MGVCGKPSVPFDWDPSLMLSVKDAEGRDEICGPDGGPAGLLHRPRIRTYLLVVAGCLDLLVVPGCLDLLVVPGCLGNL